MISYDMIIAQLEKQVVQAKNTLNDQQKREHLTAIRALCDVALQSEEATNEPMLTQPITGVSTSSTVMPSQPKPMHVISNNQAPSVVGESRLQEADANGESLFDF